MLRYLTEWRLYLDAAPGQCGEVVRYRKLGRTGLKVSEIGFGAWPLGGHGWGRQDDRDSRAALERAVDLGVNFLDTALVYGYGHSERLIGEFLRASGQREELIISTKVPPMNFHWPAVPDVGADEVFPAHHIRTHTEESLRNLRIDAIDILHLHVWADQFVNDDAWWEAMQSLKRAGKIRFVGVALNSFDPESALSLISKERVDVIQVHYNVFEQRPADALFQAAEAAGVGVIVRSPLEEGLLSGKYDELTRFDPEDFRAVYFAGDRLSQTVERVESLRPVLERAAGSLSAGALRFCISPPEVSTVLSGIRSVVQAEENVAAVDEGPLDAQVLRALTSHRWDRSTTEW